MTATMTARRPRAATLHVPAPGKVEIVDVPEQSYLVYDGAGSPQGPMFQTALQALFSLSWGAKFALKKRGVVTPTASPLEALWDVDGTELTFADHPDDMRWTALIAQPPEVTEALIAEVARDAAERKGITAVADVHLRRWHEGLCAEILHVGPYDAEGPTIARLHETIATLGYEMHGRHHEIYIGDPRRCAPERLKTILRQPIRRR